MYKDRAMTPEAPAATVRIVTLAGSFETFGLVLDHLSRIQPFATYSLGNFSRALQHQLQERTNVAALAGNRITGYCGWLPTTRANAAAWIANSDSLRPVGGSDADAVALAVVTASDRGTLLRLIREARRLSPGKQVFFKREYAGEGRPARKASVWNVVA